MYSAKKIKKYDALKITSKFQNILEIIFSFFESMVKDMLGEKYVRKFTPLVMIMFMSIFITNASSLFLFKEGAYLNAFYTFAWSLSLFLFWTFYGLYKLGVIKFIKTAFIGEFWPMAFLETIGYVIKPVSLGIRLMGNITAGTVIMTMIWSLPTIIMSALPASVLNTTLVGLLGVAGVPLAAILTIYFSLFGPFIQATVFTYLSLSNIASVLPEEEL